MGALMASDYQFFYFRSNSINIDKSTDKTRYVPIIWNNEPVISFVFYLQYLLCISICLVGILHFQESWCKNVSNFLFPFSISRNTKFCFYALLFKQWINWYSNLGINY